MPRSMPRPSDPEKTIELTPEEQAQMARAKDQIKSKAYKDRLRAERGVVTYAQRQALRRSQREAAEKKKAELLQARASSVDRRRRAFELWVAGMPKTRVGVELGVSTTTVNAWLKGMTRPEPENPPDPIDAALEEAAEDAVGDIRMAARDEEEQTLLEMADAHDKPSDKYQAYIAASAIRLLRDNMKLVRGPRTIRELSELDQLIRRNLGLNPRGGTAGGSLNIDISILNNTKASHGALGPVVVEAEEV